MGHSKNEIIEAFAREIQAADEYSKPLEMTEEQYRNLERGNVTMSGETEWTPKQPEALMPEWVEQWKRTIKPGDTESGESEWYNPEVEYDFEEEMVRRHESDVPDPSDFDPGYRYHPEEKPYRGPWHPERRPEHLKKRDERKQQQPKPKTDKPEYSDEEYFKMVSEEPEHVVTNLMLHRKSPYNQVKYILPLAKSLVDWMTEVGYSPEEGSILYEETQHMLDILEKEAERREQKGAKEAPQAGEAEQAQ